MQLQVKLLTGQVIYLEESNRQAMCRLTYFLRIFRRFTVRKNVRLMFSRPKDMMKGKSYVC